MPSAAGKGSERYKDRQQISDEMMALRWDLSFARDELTRSKILKEIQDLEDKEAACK